MRSWPLYIPAGLRDTSSYEISISTINRSWGSTVDKNLNPVYLRTDYAGQDYATRTQGHKKQKYHLSRNVGIESKKEKIVYR